MRIFIAAMAAALLAGCASVQHANESGGYIEHDPGVDSERLQGLADDECARYGLDAEISGDRSRGLVRRTDFDCVEP